MGTPRVWGRTCAVMLAVLATIAALAGAAPAGAAAAGPGDPTPPAGPTLEVSGDFTATGMLLSTCGLFNQVVDGGGEWAPLGTSTFHLDFCLESPAGDGLYPISSGSFAVTSPAGTLTGTVGGYVEAGGMPDPAVGFPLHIVLTVTGGTGAYAGAAGELVLDGAFGYGAASAWGTVSGTITLPPPTPSSVADCRHGGWRHVVDDEGQPFRSQGACIAWVRLHRA